MELYILLQDTHNPFPLTELLSAIAVAALGILIRWIEKRKMKRKFKQNSQP